MNAASAPAVSQQDISRPPGQAEEVTMAPAEEPEAPEDSASLVEERDEQLTARETESETEPWPPYALRSEIYRMWHERFCDSTFKDVGIRYFGREMGMGLVALRDFQKGDVVYRDTPLKAMQHLYSKRCCIACSHCFRIVGGFRQQLDHVLANAGKSLAKNFPEAHQALTSHVTKYLEEGLPRPLKCPHGSGEVFCSHECMQTALRSTHHRILCAEMTPVRRHKWKDFCKHARRYHENFILAGLVYADIICQVKYEERPLDLCMAEYAVFYQKPWYDLVGEDRVRRQPSSLHYREHRLKCLSESLSRLNQVFLDVITRDTKDAHTHPSIPPPNWLELFSLEYYANLLGQFDLVNMNVEFPHPLNRIIRRNMANRVTTPQNVHRALIACQPVFREVKRIVDCVEEEEEEHELPHSPTAAMAADTRDADSDENDDKNGIFPPFLGIGLFRSVALTNHSCWPNVDVDYVNCKESVVKAARPIRAGEEILQSYIDEAKPLELRQKQLQQDYGFTCQCPKCRTQAAMKLLQRRRMTEPLPPSGLPPPPGVSEVASLVNLPVDIVAELLRIDSDDRSSRSKHPPPPRQQVAAAEESSSESEAEEEEEDDEEEDENEEEEGEEESESDEEDEEEDTEEVPPRKPARRYSAPGEVPSYAKPTVSSSYRINPPAPPPPQPPPSPQPRRSSTTDVQQKKPRVSRPVSAVQHPGARLAYPPSPRQQQRGQAVMHMKQQVLTLDLAD
ncbi:unnamed protein product [Vitrella brassicaformis CCMP3155]|uniref:SET domain-containing protein n=2 Tax=Vitrella brassicaformis TaxID=1169539 RepID=A0A0G4F3X3_VITBC|nr:unnamed protein product [Vitrella brassicaformis CCMP3155]|eukprot:CEM06620.1 unnamed protein product [Vitrella brassicaformis CCMP3155]